VDLDGTLLESHSVGLKLEFIRRSLVSFKPHGGWLRAARALREVRSAVEQCPGLPSGPTNQERAHVAFGQAMALPPERARQVLDESLADIFPRLKPHFYPVPGAREFLEWAHSRFQLTLATNPVWPEALVKMRLDWAGIDPKLFDTITHAGIMHACKPTPEYYRETLTLCQASADECILVGDDYRKDFPAVRVGLPVFILSRAAQAVSIRPGKAGWADAWHGSFDALRGMLE
jgi:FMN phosphatase YigB (HAD superfamily)